MRTGAIPERKPRIARWTAALYLLAALLVSSVGPSVTAQVYSREELIEDARQLAEIIETTHPDPFVRCGGRIAFYYVLDGILNAIPADGMTRDGFIRLIRPLAASVGDAHTDVWSSYRVSNQYPRGVPLRFGVVEESLYVKAVTTEEDERYLGSRLVSVEGHSVPELMAKQRTLVGLENDYHVLLELAEQTLWYEPYLEELLPEWTDHDRIAVELRLPSGEVETVTFELPTLTLFLRDAPSAIEVPDANEAGFYAGFIDVPAVDGVEETAAYVRIDHQAGFREFLEENATVGANDTTPEERARVPSATEAFRDLAIGMKERGTETLIVDLRFDTGGTDTMADILVYFLYGFDGLKAYRGETYLSGGFSAMRYSALYFENCTNQSIEQVNEDREGVPIEVGEYDFDDYRGQEEAIRAAMESIDVQAYLAEDYAGKPTFYDEFVTGDYAGYYCPANVVVLVSPKTFSAGSTTMRALSLAGATLFGTPSGQSMKGFGNGTLWELDHTGVQGIISRSYFDPYPDDPARGEVWPIDVPLTYDYLASTGFDPNAELLLAFDWIEAQEQAKALARLEAKVASLREALRIPGLSAAVVKDGELIWARGFGTAELEDGIEATAETPYGLASVTKPFAAFLLMKKVEAGELDLDTPVADFGIDLGNDAITVRHLLSHTSEGIPGSYYQYSGNRYSYLTAVIEQLYGDSFRAALRREILAPLGMDDTALNVGGCGLGYYLSRLAPDDPERAFEHVYRESAVPYAYDADYEVYPVPVPSYANAAAGLISTVVDLARFAAAIESDELVSAETKAEMFTPTALNWGAEGPYGLGWFTERYGETELIWHYGYGAYSSLFLMVPSEGLTFVVLANTQNLSRPFGLGLEGVSVLGSPLALAFFKELVLRPRHDEPLPEIDWTADQAALIARLAGITDPELRELYEGELWTYRKLYGGVGRSDLTSRLLMVHMEAFRTSGHRTANDLYVVDRPGPRPPESESVALSEAEAARWVGRFALRPEDAESGLPLEVDIFVDGGRIIAVPADGECQEFLPVTPYRLVSSENPDMFLVAEEAEGPFESAFVEYGGERVGTYDRIE